MTENEKARHDFKNQLGVIRGLAELLLDEAAAGDPRRPDFEAIHTAAEAAIEILARAFPDPPLSR